MIVEDKEMTIKDIASLADVSVSTVSKILNNKDADISEETRKKVIKIAKEYQYTPYSKFRENISGKSHTLGLVVPRQLRHNTTLISGMEKTATQNGYGLQVYFTETALEEAKYIKILAGKKADGILLYGIDNMAGAIEILQNEKLPFVLLKKEERIPAAAQIYFDYEKIGYLAANHLIDLGHRNIGFLMDHSDDSIKMKEGYVKALYENDIPYDADKIFVGQDEAEAGKIGIHQFFNRNITAVICENEKIACAAYQTCECHGVQIPKDLSVLNLEDAGLGEILNPKLDAIALPYDLLSSSAVLTLVDMIENKVSPHACSREMEVQVIKRESTSKPVLHKRSKMKKIVVVGSMNIDVTINVEKLPTDGETLISNHMALLPGGKGGNQAVGAGKLGGLVYAIGCLGNDNDGKRIYNSLVENSVKTDGVYFDSVAATGKAYITVAKEGESTIVVYPGANHNLDVYQLRKYRKLFEGAQYCLLSLEITKKAAMYAINLCAENNVRLMVKPSTITSLEDKYLKKIEFLIPNEKELHQLVEGEYDISHKAGILFEKGVKNIIVTLGNKGCYLKNEKYELFFDAAPFEPLDTTGAADAFISALAVYLGEGYDILSAIQFATYCAGISITRQGVQNSLPDRMTIDVYQDEIINIIKKVKSNII